MTTTRRIKTLRIIAYCALICSLASNLSAQDTNVDWGTASDDQVILQAIELTTPTPSNEVPDYATFYSAQHSPISAQPWPPLPGNVENFNAWDLGSNIWVLDDLGFDYNPVSTPAARPMMAMADSGILPPETNDDEGGTNTLFPAGAPIALNPGTNLWIAQEVISNGYFTGILSNTIPGVEYQLLSMNSLRSNQWIYQGGPILAYTNWAPWSVPFDATTNFFLNALSFQDSTGTGIPDWWWLKYFGQDTNTDAYADPLGDGYTLYEDYVNGWVPTNWMQPPAPQGLTIDSFDSGNNTATLSWLPSPGPVTGYMLQTPSGNVSLGNDVTTYVDYSSSLNASYAIEAEYTGGISPWSQTIWVDGGFLGPALDGAIVPGPQGNLYLAISSLPPSITEIQIDRYSADLGGAQIGVFPKSDDYVNLGNSSADPLPNGSFEIQVADIKNGIYELPSSSVTPFFPYEFIISAVDSNGVVNSITSSGLPDSFGKQALAEVPFLDLRRHLKDNLQFLLRAADDTSPFLFEVISSGDQPFHWPTNHVCVDFYDDANGVRSYPDPSEPVEDNMIYRNFVFDPNNLAPIYNGWNLGLVNTGIYYYPTFYEGNLAFNFGEYLPPNFEYYFNPLELLGQSNPVIPASALGFNQTQWLAPATYNGYIKFFTNFSTLGDSNIYGLPFVSAQGAWYQGNSLYTQIYYPGRQDATNGLLYPDAKQPSFQIINYYFCRPGIDEMPEANDFSSTNPSPLIIVPVGGEPQSNQSGTASQLAAYARVAVGNAYPGVYGYIGQYFTNAYEIDSSGKAITNSAGILSPYGQFFATQPGPAALTTWPDIDTGQQGTCTVYCVSLDVDKNHDGVIDTSYNGQDTTSQGNPMEFWVNNGCDAPNTSPSGGLDRNLEVPPNAPNYTQGHITCQRDLENFARLWICGMPTLPTNGNYQVTLSWNNVSGNPAINLYNSVETNGGTGYLTDTNIAAEQCTATTISDGMSPYTVSFVGPDIAIANITPSSSYTFPATNFLNGSNQYFLFEGAGIGKGELMMTISQNGNAIAQSGVWLDLHDVVDFYERAHIENVLKTFPAMRNNTNASSFVSDYELPDNASGTNQLVVYVHGWRMSSFAYQLFSDTMYKRLYWQGYQGRFASLRWSTLSEDDFWFFSQVEAFQTYNPSEYIAFRSAQGTSDYFNWLKSRFPNYSINVAAHSMGNIVMMEALKIQLAEGHKDIDNYVLMQAAVPASCYDADAPGCPSLIAQESDAPTPNEYLTYPGSINSALNGVMINFYNTNDFALNFWVANQDLMKPDGTLGYTVLPVLQTYLFPSTLITDPREIMAFSARPRSYACGAQTEVQGVISEENQVDLTAQFGFGNAYWDHSGEFNRDIQQTGGFYKALMSSLFIH